MSSSSLKDKTANALLWGGINNGAQQVLNLVFGIFLARLLSPADYGMVGMLTIFSLIATSLQESGFISGLNRKKTLPMPTIMPCSGLTCYVVRESMLYSFSVRRLSLRGIVNPCWCLWRVCRF